VVTHALSRREMPRRRAAARGGPRWKPATSRCLGAPWKQQTEADGHRAGRGSAAAERHAASRNSRKQSTAGGGLLAYRRGRQVGQLIDDEQVRGARRGLAGAVLGHRAVARLHDLSEALQDAKGLGPVSGEVGLQGPEGGQLYRLALLVLGVPCSSSRRRPGVSAGSSTALVRTRAGRPADKRPACGSPGRSERRNLQRDSCGARRRW
jgi:hypothetical protein